MNNLTENHPPTYFDTHCHLTLSTSVSPAKHLALAKKANVNYIFDPGLHPHDIKSRRQTLACALPPPTSSTSSTYASPPPHVLLGGALAPHFALDHHWKTTPKVAAEKNITADPPPHPTSLAHNNKISIHNPQIQQALACLEEHIRAKEINAIGEIGLEYFHINHPAHQAMQAQLLHEQLSLAKTYNLPVSLHLRSSEHKNAFQKALAIIQAVKPTAPIIAHCFTGNAADAQAFLAYGAYISFAGILTFKKATSLQEIAQTLPLNHILLETDAPYLTPVPMRSKPNISPYIVHTYKFLSKLRNIAEERLSETLVTNAKIAFQLPPH